MIKQIGKQKQGSGFHDRTDLVNKSCSDLLDGRCGLGVFTLAVWYLHKEEPGMIQYNRFLEISHFLFLFILQKLT